MAFTQLKEPFMVEARFRQAAGGGDKKSEKAKSVKTKSSEPMPQVAEILAKKAGIGQTTMKDALAVDKHGTEEEKKAVISGKASVSAVAKEIRGCVPKEIRANIHRRSFVYAAH